MTRCWFVDDHKADYRIVRLCLLVELPRATYYRWATPTLSDQYLDDAYLANEIFDIHQASRCTYGSPRVWGQLRRAGTRVGEKRVARLMAVLGLVGAHSRKKWRRGASTAPAGDLIERDFTAEASDSRWVADITEFACLDGKLYLAGILDLHDRGVAGWSMGERQTNDLVVNALVMALTRRDPDDDVVHHVGSRFAIYVARIREQSRRLGRYTVVRRDRGVLGQRRDGIDMGDHQTRYPPHLRRLERHHPLRAAHDSVRLHRDVLQPNPTPSRPRAPHPRRGLRCLQSSMKPHNHPRLTQRGNSRASPLTVLGQRRFWGILAGPRTNAPSRL